jgi:hypothetical protein
VHGDFPVFKRADLPAEWQEEKPVLCIAGRTALDEAAGIMLAQLCDAHGLRARVEGPGALSTNNIFRLETDGVAIVCLSYLNATNPAQIRYAVRRIRRKLPKARVLVGLWNGSEAVEGIDIPRDGSGADLFAYTLRDATRLCIESVRLDIEARTAGLDARPVANPAL